jgi:hypothetical protein
MVMTYQLLTLQTDKGYEVLAYTKGEFSKRDVRRLTKKFRNDADVIKAGTSTWERFYDSVEEMKKDLPEV